MRRTVVVPLPNDDMVHRHAGELRARRLRLVDARQVYTAEKGAVGVKDIPQFPILVITQPYTAGLVEKHWPKGWIGSGLICHFPREQSCSVRPGRITPHGFECLSPVLVGDSRRRLGYTKNFSEATGLAQD